MALLSNPTPAVLDEFPDQLWQFLESTAAVVEAPLTHIAEQLRAAILPYLPGSALVIYTEECTGRPQKKTGEEGIISRVTIPEMDHLRASCHGEASWRGQATVGGQNRDVLAMNYPPSGAVLVITDPGPPAGTDGRPGVPRPVTYLWNLAARRIQEKVADAPPSYLLESRAASAERMRVTAELVDQHSTTLETILAALRSTSLDDASARSSVIDLTAKALIDLRTVGDRTAELGEEPVATAFERLRQDLAPLMRFSAIDVQFVEPPENGRALPGEVAHAARAIVRGLVLAMVEQPDVRRVRAQWDCDGENLLINVRDDGRGDLSPEASNISRLSARVEALDGTMTVDVMPGWGADISVTLPLDPPAGPAADVAGWGLGAREQAVLQLLATGQRNRGIAAALHISENTVKFHVRNLYKKLDVRSRSEAIALAHSSGLR